MRSLAHDAYIETHPSHPDHRAHTPTRWTLHLCTHLPDHVFAGIHVSLLPERVLVRQVYRALADRHGPDMARDGVRRIMRVNVLANDVHRHLWARQRGGRG